MATEKLSVVLELVTGSYKREAQAAATSTEQVARAADKAASASQELGSNVRTAGQAVGRSSGEYGKLAEQVARSVRESSQLEREMFDLGKSLGLSEKEARDFAKQMTRVAAETDQAGREADVAGSRFDSLRGRLGGLVAGLGIGLGIHEIGRFFGQAINDAAELEQSIGGVEAVFGRLSNTILQASREAAQNVGLSERAYQQLAARLGGQLQTFGFTAEETVDKTQELIRVGADLAATYGGTVSEAIEAISALLRGESNPIERYAIAINQTAINARAMELGLAASKTQVDFHAKAVAALDLLTQQSARSQGQFAREAKTAAGQQERLNAELENQRAALGTELLPLWVELLQLARDLAPQFKEVATEVANIAVEVGEALVPLAEFLAMLKEVDEFQSFRRGAQDPLNLEDLKRDVPFLNRALEFMGRSLRMATPEGQIRHWVNFWKTIRDTRQASEETREAIDAINREFHNDTAIKKAIAGYDDLVPMVEDADRAMMNMAARNNAPEILRRMGEEAGTAVPDLQDFAEAVRDVRTAMLEAADPAFAAIAAQTRADEAISKADEAKTAWENGEGSAQDYLQAVSDAAQAVLEADAANAALGANAGKHLRPLQNALDTVTEKLEEPRIQAQELLETLQVIDSQGNIVIRVDVDMDPADRALLEGVSSGRLQGPQRRRRGPARSGPGGNVTFRQHGGPVRAFQPTVVGERGPELMVPSQPGFVASNADFKRLIAALSRGGGGNISFNFERTDPHTDAQLAGELAMVARRMEVA